MESMKHPFIRSNSGPPKIHIRAGIEIGDRLAPKWQMDDAKIISAKAPCCD